MKTVIYNPTTRAKVGVFTALFGLIAQARRFKWQIGVNFRRDFQLLYKQTGLGLFWAFALPIVPITLYTMLAKFRFLPQADGMDPAVYITAGVTLWYLYAGAITEPLNAVASKGGIAVRTEYPLIGTVLASFAQLVFDTFVRMGAVAVVFAITKTIPPWMALLSPFMAVAFLPLFFGAGLIFSIANSTFADVGKVTGVLLSYGIFVSAVIFPIPEQFIIWNPFALALDSVRDLLVFGTINHPVAISVLMGIGIVVLLMGCRLFYVMEYRVKGLL